MPKKQQDTKTLSITDRLIIIGLFNGKASFEELRIQKSILEKVEFSADEIMELEIKTVDSGITWNKKKEKSVEVLLNRLEQEEIGAKLAEMDEKKELTHKHLPLCEMFLKK